MNIAIDLDKTLFNCNSVIYKFYNKLQEYKKLNKKLVYKTVSDEKKTNIGFLKFFSSAFNPDKYEEIADAISIIKSWKDNGNTITFLSSRPYNIKAVKNSVISWLSKNDVPYDKLILGCKNKGDFCKKFNIDLLIDDTLTNCISACDHGVPAICLTKTEKLRDRKETEYNNKIFFADNWNAINIITSIIQKKKLINSKFLFENVINKKNNDFDYLIMDASLLELRNIGLTKPLNLKDVIINKNIDFHFIKSNDENSHLEEPKLKK